jgi:alginate O-acetyltransferase complex protein AlgI
MVLVRQAMTPLFNLIPTASLMSDSPSPANESSADSVIPRHPSTSSSPSEEVTGERFQSMADACTRIGFGMGKLVLLSLAIMPMGAAAFGAGEGSISTFCAWLGAVAYSLGFYFGFSGSIDIFVGLGQLVGVKFQDTFVAPYHAPSCSVFWQRWVVPMPLSVAGVASNSAVLRVFFNMLLILLVTACWHGFSVFNAIAWVAMHLILLAWERWSVAHQWLQRLPQWSRVLFTFLLITFSWGVLGTSSLDHAVRYFAALFGQVSITEIAMVLQAQILTDYHLVSLVFAACIVWLANPARLWLGTVTIGKAISALLLAVISLLLLLAR